MIDRDPEHYVSSKNRALIKNLQELDYKRYRREIHADMTYGFQEGDAKFWRERLTEEEYAGDEENGVQMPHCAICMDYFRPDDTVSPMPCHVTHLYHTDCIKPWLLKN